MSEAELIRAFELLQVGSLQEAADVYRGILQTEPHQADACYYLGVIASRQGLQKDAQEWMERAVSSAPKIGLYWYGKAVVEQQQALPEHALQSYRQAIVLQPDLFDARFNLATMLLQAGQFEEAEPHYLQLLPVQPSQPRHRDVLNHLGSIAQKRGLTDQAIDYYRQALQVDPQFAEAGNNLGTMLQAQNRLDEAIAAFEQAIQSRPDIPQLHNNLGNVLKVKGQLERAEACYHEAIRLNPGYSSPYRNLGILLRGLRQVAPAIAYLEKALALNPTHIETLLDLADTLLMQNRATEAVQRYEQAFAMEPRPAIRIKLARVLPRFYQSQAELNEWRQRFTQQFERLAQESMVLKNPLTEVGAANFYLAYQGLDNRAVNEQVGQLFANAYAWQNDFRQRDTNGQSLAEKNVAFLRNVKLKIGFLSTYFTPKHTISKLYGGLMEKLSREQFDVHVYLPEGKARLAISADCTQRVFNPENLSQSAELVSQDALDVLFYPDIGMEPLTYFMGFHRLAPVQCVSWGHPDTTGIPSIDYFISSRLLEADDAQQDYTEKLILLDTLPTYYHHPIMEADALGRAHFGFSESAHVYLCPQSLFKFHPEFDAVLAQILRDDQQGVLVLVNANYTEWADMLMSRFQRSMPDVAHRVTILHQLGQREFFSLLMLANVVLDTLHFGGGNTTYETLAFGTPIVTMPQRLMRSRVTAGCYRKMDMAELIVHSTGAYAQKAVQVATEPDYREQVTRQILARNHALFEDMEAVQQLAHFFQEAVASTPFYR